MRFAATVISHSIHSGRVSRRLTGLRLFSVSRHFLYLKIKSNLHDWITVQSSKLSITDKASCSVVKANKQNKSKFRFC